MTFIEILQVIKQKLHGFFPEYTMKDLWEMLQKQNITPDIVFKYLIEQNVGIEEIVPFFDVMGLQLDETLELFIDLGVYYNEHDFIHELEKKYGKEQIMDAYRNSSLDENVVNRILLDYYDVDGLPQEIKKSMIRRRTIKKGNLQLYWLISI